MASTYKLGSVRDEPDGGEVPPVELGLLDVGAVLERVVEGGRRGTRRGGSHSTRPSLVSAASSPAMTR